MNFNLKPFPAQQKSIKPDDLLKSSDHAHQRELLEKSKLSRLPAFKPPTFDDAPVPTQSNTPPVAAPKCEKGVCAGCGVKLPKTDDFAQLVGACRDCLGIKARVESRMNDTADERARAAKLLKLAGRLK